MQSSRAWCSPSNKECTCKKCYASLSQSRPQSYLHTINSGRVVWKSYLLRTAVVLCSKSRVHTVVSTPRIWSTWHFYPGTWRHSHCFCGKKWTTRTIWGGKTVGILENFDSMTNHPKDHLSMGHNVHTQDLTGLHIHTVTKYMSAPKRRLQLKEHGVAAVSF